MLIIDPASGKVL